MDNAGFAGSLAEGEEAQARKVDPNASRGPRVRHLLIDRRDGSD